MEGNWIFASYNNAGDDGLNDAGIETFSAQAEVSNIREVIQNSLDQISESAKNNNLPVIVEFDDFYIEPFDFPNNEEFQEIIKKCIESSNNEQTKEFFNNALNLLNNRIRVLRISDYNTTGLEGAEDDDRDKSWHSLVKSNGHSNKNMTSGGSFGIGKSAPFKCSGLRTVFYGSKVDNIDSCIGVARLISHEGNHGLTLGKGYFSNNNDLKAILEPAKIGKYRRTTNGTDIFIMGYEGADDIEKLIRETTLTNFFVSIFRNQLEVKYKDNVINKGNIGQLIADLDNDNELFEETKIYYDMLNTYPTEDDEDDKRIVLDSSEFGAKYGIQDGEATLLLRKADDLNKRILMTRKPGMSLFKQGYINGSISFTGLLLIEGEKMNGLFKDMEMPAHDAWEPTRCNVDKEKYIEAYAELKKYLKDKVSRYFSQTNEDSISAYGMDEFFSSSSEENGKAKISILEGKVKTKATKKKIQRKKSKIVPKSGGEDDIPPEERENPGNGSSNGSNSGGSGKDNPDTKDKKYKLLPLKKALRCNDEKSGKYTLSFNVDKDKKKVKLEFLVIAEKGSYQLPIIDSSIENNNGYIMYVSNNNIYISNISHKEPVKLDFTIDFDHKCMMEVNYYEAR